MTTAIMETGAESGREDIARAARLISLTLSMFAATVERSPARLADTIGCEGEGDLKLVQIDSTGDHIVNLDHRNR